VIPTDSNTLGEVVTFSNGLPPGNFNHFLNMQPDVLFDPQLTKSMYFTMQAQALASHIDYSINGASYTLMANPQVFNPHHQDVVAIRVYAQNTVNFSEYVRARACDYDTHSHSLRGPLIFVAYGQLNLCDFLLVMMDVVLADVLIADVDDEVEQYSVKCDYKLA
jgi:hypothetical protein